MIRKLDLNKVIKPSKHVPFNELLLGHKKKKFVAWLISKHKKTIDDARIICWKVFTNNGINYDARNLYDEFLTDMERL